METSKQLGQYKEVQISTAPRGKLILMLYQGAIKALKKSLELIDKKDFEGKGEQLIKAQDIVMELNLALDMEAGEIPSSLRQLYLYVYRRLLNANLNLDKEAVNEAIRILETLYGAWEVAIQKVEGDIKGDVATSSFNITG